MAESLSTSITTLIDIINTCNDKKATVDISELQNSLYQTLYHIINDVFHSESIIPNQSVVDFEGFLTTAFKGKKTWKLFTKPTIYTLCDYIRYVYCERNENASDLIQICVKNISSSKYSSIRLTCWSILQILFKNYYSSCISIVDDILSLISKSIKYADKNELIVIIQVFDIIIQDSQYYQQSLKLPSLLLSIYKLIDNRIQKESLLEVVREFSKMAIHIPFLLSSIETTVSSNTFIDDLLCWLSNEDELLGSIWSEAIASLFTQLIIHQPSRDVEKTEESVLNSSFISLQTVSFEGISTWILQELSSNSSYSYSRNLVAVLIHLLNKSKEVISERDISTLINQLHALLKVNNSYDYQVFVESIIIDGVCKNLSETYISLITTTIVKKIQEITAITKDDEPILYVFIRLLIKIAPILGEVIVNDWKTYFSLLLPSLECSFQSLQMAAYRCLLVIATIDSLIIEDLILQCLQALKQQLDSIEKTQTLDHDSITGVCKMIGSLLMLLYSKNLSLSASILQTILSFCERLASLYMALVLSAPDPEVKIIVETTFQCLYEGLWYIQQGVILINNEEIIPAVNTMLQSVHDLFARIRSVLDSINNKSEIPEYTIKSLNLLYPLYQFLYLLLKYRPDLCQKYSIQLSSIWNLFQKHCSLLQDIFSNLSSYAEFLRIIWITLMLIVSLPSSIILQGLDSYISLSLIAFSSFQDYCTYDTLIVIDQDRSFLKLPQSKEIELINTIDKVCYEESARSIFDIEDESFIILLNKLQSYYISTVLPSVSQISSSLNIPIIQMVPSTSAFYSRFANAVIQAFVSLFMIVDNNTQNRMIEYALSTISKKLADKELKDIYINNFCCILWNITQMAMDMNCSFATSTWKLLVRDFLFSAFESEDVMTRYIASQAVAQLCLVTSEIFLCDSVSSIYDLIDKKKDSSVVTICIYCVCYLSSFQRSPQQHNNDAYQIIFYYTKQQEPFPSWCLFSLSHFVHQNPTIQNENAYQSFFDLLQTVITQQSTITDDEELMQFQLAWIEAVNSVCEEINPQQLQLYSSNLEGIIPYVDYIWDSTKNTCIKQACLRLYARLCCIPSCISVLFHHIRSSLQCSSSPLRYTAIICLKQLCTSSPSLLFDSSSTLIISLKELLLCYQKCIVNDSSQIVNACSDLFITILTMKLNSLQPYSIPSLWKFLCELTTPVMGDAPLSSLVQQSVVQQPIIDNNDTPLEHTRCHSPIVMEEEEWMWQTLLLSLEGSYSVIEVLMKLLTVETPSLSTILTELVRFACYNTTLCSDCGSIEGIQLFGLTVLTQLFQHFGDLPDSEDPNKHFFSQFEVQLTTAIRYVFSENRSTGLLETALNVFRLILSKHLITDTNTIDRLLSMLLPVEATSTLLEALNHTKVNYIVSFIMEALNPSSSYDKETKDVILTNIHQNTKLWYTCLFSELKLISSIIPHPHYLMVVSYLLSDDTPENDIVFLIYVIQKYIAIYQNNPNNEEYLICALGSMLYISSSISHLSDFSFKQSFIQYCLAVIKLALSLPNHSVIHSYALRLLAVLLQTIAKTAELSQLIKIQEEDLHNYEPIQTTRDLLSERVSAFQYAIDPPELISEKPKIESISDGEWNDDDTWENAFESDQEKEKNSLPKENKKEEPKKEEPKKEEPKKEEPKKEKPKKEELSIPLHIPKKEKKSANKKQPTKRVVKVKPERAIHTGFSDDDEENDLPQERHQTRRRGKKGVSLNSYVQAEEELETEPVKQEELVKNDKSDQPIQMDLHKSDQPEQAQQPEQVQQPEQSEQPIQANQLDQPQQPSSTKKEEKPSTVIQPVITRVPQEEEWSDDWDDVPSAPSVPKKVVNDDWDDDEEWDMKREEIQSHERVVEESSLGSRQVDNHEEEEIVVEEEKKEEIVQESNTLSNNPEDSLDMNRVVQLPSHLQYHYSNTILCYLFQCISLAFSTPGSWKDIISVVNACHELFLHNSSIEGMICERLVTGILEETLSAEDISLITASLQEIVRNSSIFQRAISDKITIRIKERMTEDFVELNQQGFSLLHSIYCLQNDSEIAADLIDIYITIFSSSLYHSEDAVKLQFRLHYLSSYLQSLNILEKKDISSFIQGTVLNILMCIASYLDVLNEEEMKNCIDIISLLYSKTEEKVSMIPVFLKVIGCILLRVKENKKLHENGEDVVYMICKENGAIFKDFIQTIAANENEVLQQALRSAIERKKGEIKRSHKKVVKMPISIDISKF